MKVESILVKQEPGQSFHKCKYFLQNSTLVNETDMKDQINYKYNYPTVQFTASSMVCYFHELIN